MPLFDETRVEIAAMRAHEDDYDEQTRDMLEGLAFACAQYNTFLKGAGETKKSIIITTGVHLAPLQVREVRRILSGDDIHLESLDEGKRVVYLELPDTNATFGFLASVFYQCLFETLVRKANHTDGGRLGRDAHCLLDEFANIGKIPNFVRLVATIRSRGISCSIILQTVSQGKSLYKDDWKPSPATATAGSSSAVTKPPPPKPSATGSATKPSTSSKPAKPKARTAPGAAASARTPESSLPPPRRTRPPRHRSMHLPATRPTTLPQPQTDGLGRRAIHMLTV